MEQLTIPMQGLNVLDAINARTSVRSYRPEPVSDALLNSLLQAAVRAPTAMHGEPWQFIVVQDAGLLRRLSDQAKRLLHHEMARLHLDRGAPRQFSDPDFNIFYNAGTLIVICAVADRPFATADCWLAAQNLMLAAHAHGLGSCVIGSAVGALNGEPFRKELGIGHDVTAIAPLIVGWPAASATPSPRNPPRILSWHKPVVA